LLAAKPNQAITSRIPRTQIDSSAITSIGYSKHQHALEIEFPNGAIYRYLDVPAQAYRDLLAASSKAGYYYANIRHHFHSIHVKPAGGSSARPRQ
jgi:KTSC domain